jgi:hypothetical protein
MDQKVYLKNGRPVRSPTETLLTISLPKQLKLDMKEVAEESDRSLSEVVRYCFEFAQGRDFRDIPEMAAYWLRKGQGKS